MIARWDSKCSICSKSVKAGDDVHYDAEAKQVSHWPCRENQQPTAEQYAIAQHLGYISHDAALHQVWSALRFLPGGNRINGERKSGEAPGEQGDLWSVRTGREGEE